MLKKSYVSKPYFDRSKSITYAFGKINAVIIDDVDNNGFVDFVTFPSNYTESIPLEPVVWLNNRGIFSASITGVVNAQDVQYFRDTISGDFNGDGFTDYIQLDQGWELNGRNPDFFFGNHPALLRGQKDGLQWVDRGNWINNSESLPKTFNHIGDAADFDDDGDLDFLVAGFVDFRLYVNDGSGRFDARKDLFPTKFNVPVFNERLLSNSPEFSVSGSTFIKLGSQFGVIAGPYRSYDANDPTGFRLVQVLEQRDGKFEVSYELPRPDLGGRERNFGAADMYNVDLNADGREDLVILWEGEGVKGVDDGQSNIGSGPFADGPRYKDISDNIMTVYLQDISGGLNSTGDFYNLFGKGSGFHIYFEDFNGDGHLDLWNSSYGVHPTDFDRCIWINDGSGKFANPTSPMFTTQEKFEPWFLTSPFFFDANNDGRIDVVTLNPVFGDDSASRNIGEEIRVFLGENPTKVGSKKILKSIPGAERLKDVVMDANGLINLSMLNEQFEIELFWAKKAPNKKMDATGAVWFKKGMLQISIDADSKPEFFVELVGVRKVAASDLILGHE